MDGERRSEASGIGEVEGQEDGLGDRGADDRWYVG